MTMEQLPVFLSVVVLTRNCDSRLDSMIRAISASVASLARDHELIIVDNASTDESVARLKKLTSVGGIPNLQVFTLTKEVDSDTAASVGVEHSLGDYVAIIDPLLDQIDFIGEMLRTASEGADVVLAVNETKPRRTFAYRVCSSVFNVLYRRLSGIDLERDAPPFRLLSRKVVHHLLRHQHPAVSYRHLPVTAGFARKSLQYRSAPTDATVKRLEDGFDRGMRLLVSTTRVPMRLVTALTLFGAGANVIYSAYVLLIAMFKSDVAPGWVTLSLQQSGMFFLLSLVMLVLGEYLLNVARASSDGPAYHIAQEFTSAEMSGRRRLNIETHGDLSDAKESPTENAP
ncbi:MULTISPECIES: glycosyltransferase [unclassified Caballeronia]|uniref:glycosyltransferase n=1 Tax=unclassified Caballeronia TaxID=2646786 RepID=UPI0032EFE42D